MALKVTYPEDVFETDFDPANVFTIFSIVGDVLWVHAVESNLSSLDTFLPNNVEIQFLVLLSLSGTLEENEIVLDGVSHANLKYEIVQRSTTSVAPESLAEELVDSNVNFNKTDPVNRW